MLLQMALFYFLWLSTFHCTYIALAIVNHVLLDPHSSSEKQKQKTCLTITERGQHATGRKAQW